MSDAAGLPGRGQAMTGVTPGPGGVRNSRRLPGRVWAVLAAGLVLFLALDSYATYVLFTSRYPGANDFYARWQPLHAWLQTGQDPYSDAATRDTQIVLYGAPAGPNDSNFYYPLYSALFFGLPALISSYAWASAVWLTILEASLLALTILSITWSRWRPHQPFWPSRWSSPCCGITLLAP